MFVYFIKTRCVNISVNIVLKIYGERMFLQIYQANTHKAVSKDFDIMLTRKYLGQIIIS